MFVTHGLKIREVLMSVSSLRCSLDRGDMQALVFSSLVCLQPLDERVELLPTVEEVSPCELYNLHPGSTGVTLVKVTQDNKVLSKNKTILYSIKQAFIFGFEDVPGLGYHMINPA